MLGYKENSRDFVFSKKTDKKIKLNYSIANKLKLLGYPSQYINIGELYEKVENDIKDMVGHDTTPDREETLKEIISNIIRRRIYNLKKVINQFQRFVWKIKNTTSIDVKLERLDVPRQDIAVFADEEIDPFTRLLDKYQKKLTNINLEDNNGKHKIFKHWKAVVNNLFPESLEDKVINIGNDRLLNAEEISKYDTNGNLLLYYIVSEIDKLIHFNQNKFVKTNAIMFMIDFINFLFGLFNTEEIFNMLDIKRFIYILNSQGYLYDIEQKGHGLEETQGIYEEYRDPDEIESEEHVEAEEEAEEEAQALDVDMSYDDALDYIVQMDDWEPANFGTIEG